MLHAEGVGDLNILSKLHEFVKEYFLLETSDSRAQPPMLAVLVAPQSLFSTFDRKVN
jgi:hypothetical protein